jgi:ATP-dependent Lon protease
MPSILMPLFPLPLVLLPATAVSLHIFEERYKQMVGEVMLTKGEFGLVLAKDDGIVSIGCTAVVERVLKRYPDGRMDIIVVGRRRFRIESLNEDKPYLQAEFEIFEDAGDETVSGELRQRAIAATQQLRAIESPDVVVEPLPESPYISFQLAQFIGDADKRQTVLSMRSEVERLRFLISVLPGYTTERERVMVAKRLAPLNGHAKHVHQQEG